VRNKEQMVNATRTERLQLMGRHFIRREARSMVGDKSRLHSLTGAALTGSKHTD
jgi:hypothetical protein